MLSRILFLGLVVVVPATVMGEDVVPPAGVWTGKGQLGYLASQGNTDAKSINAMLDMTMVNGLCKHVFHLGGLYGESSGITSAERWDTLWQSNYDVSEDSFAFGALRYAHDIFSGFEYQATISTGMGYKFIHNDTTQLSGQVGIGYKQSRPESILKDDVGIVTARIRQDAIDEGAFTAGLDYIQALTATTNLSNKLLVESAPSDTLITDALALTVKVSTRLALSLGYSFQENTKPPEGLKKVDTVETVNLVFSF